MEEILSSIRRIIADDQEEEGAGAKPATDPTKAEATKPAAAPGEEDVLDLTQVVGGGEAPPATPPALDADAGEVDLELEEDDDEPAPVAAPPKPAAKVPDSEDSLVSAPAASASTSAFARLAKAAASNEQPARGFGDKTVEAFLTDLLKPMLKDWLDQNLEGVVERVVEQEVKKLARRAELM